MKKRGPHSPRSLFSQLFGLLIVIAFVSGCGGGAVSGSRPGMSVEQLINNFVLLNEYSEPLAVRDPATGLSPYGAMVYAKDKSDRIYCSVTHVAAGIISTASHCVENFRNLLPTDFYVFFYSNETGRLEVTTLESAIYIGQQDFDDIAILRIPEARAKEWDVYGSPLAKTVRRFASSAIDNKVQPELEKPAIENVTIRSFRPIANPGMMFAPLHCQASRTLPWVAKDGGKGAPLDAKKYVAPNKRLDPSTHLFVNNCDATTVYGNSGASITSDRTGQLLGVFDWNLPRKRFGTNELIFANAREWKKVWTGAPEEKDLASVLDIGTAYDAVLTRLDVLPLLPSALKLP